MRIYLSGKVSRRLILQFVLAALIPMSGMAWYVYHEVSALLLKSAYQQLRADSKSFGMSLIEILNNRANALKQLSQENIGNVPMSERLGFRKTAVATPRNLTADQQTHLDRGGAVLRLAAGSRVELLVSSTTPGRTLTGEIDTASLWTNDSSPESYCVLDADDVALFCTPGLKPLDKQTVELALNKGNGGTVRWNHLGKDLLVGMWRPGFMPAFDSRGFLVMQVTSKADALRTLEHFRRFFPIIFLLALALATFLAIRQIRRQMQPLDLLTKVSQQLASGDLTARMEVAGNDEFFELGRTFNDMAGKLEYRFHMLAMLSDLDRAIISASRMEHVADEVLKHIQKAIPCDGAGILIQHGGQGYELLTSSPEGIVEIVRLPTSQIELPSLSRTQSASVLPLDTLPEEALLRLSGTVPSQLVGFPIPSSDCLQHVLLLAHGRQFDASDHRDHGGRALADRLGIALSSLAQEEKLHHQAHYDSLTDLPNRVLLRLHCDRAVDQARLDNTAVALILIDLDNFKQVNDTLGHACGDELLSKCAIALNMHMRQGDVLARLGGDEFVILLQDLPVGQEHQTLEGRLRELMVVLSASFTVNEYKINTPASMGIALYPRNAAHFDELLQMADAAMYKAKREQRGGFQFYSDDLSERSKTHFDLTQELRKAVERDELVLYFQPKVDARTRQIVGAEALVRWFSPARGVVGPNSFVHLLDEMGLGAWLGGWVLDRACAQMREWQDADLVSVPISINFSPVQFERTSVLQEIRACLSRYQLDATRLEIEILEETAVNDSQNVQAALAALRDEGVRIALDDFGTGYSSLVYLTRVPANVLKLDQAFIRSLSSDTRQQGIVKHIIALAKSLSYCVVAEGVEEEAQLSLLVDMDCDQIQGYLIGHPLPPNEFADRWLR